MTTHLSSNQRNGQARRSAATALSGHLALGSTAQRYEQTSERGRQLLAYLPQAQREIARNYNVWAVGGDEK